MKIVNDVLTNDALCKAQVELLERKEQDYKLIGSMRVVPGHTLWSYNTVTGEIKAATVESKVGVGMDGRPFYTYRTTVEKDCFYDYALNVKNFVKRLKRYGLYKEGLTHGD